MPAGDKTGPRGQGSMTGRGMGYCMGNRTPRLGIGQRLGFGRGPGRWFGRGFARGFGFRGFNHGFPNQIQEPRQKDHEISYLENELKGLEQERENIKKRIEELKK